MAERNMEGTELFLPNFVLGPEIANQLSHPLGESEGLLIGRLRIRRTLVLTDQQEATEKKDPILCADSFYPGNLFKALRLDGRDDGKPSGDTKIASWLRPGEKVIGWYRFRRERKFEPSFQEWLIHRKLMAACQPHLVAPAEWTVFLMFGITRDDKHTLQHQTHALRFDNEKFLGIRSFMFEPKRPSVIGCYRGGPSEYPETLLDTAPASVGPSKAVSALVDETETAYQDLINSAGQLVIQLDNLHQEMLPTRHDLPLSMNRSYESITVSPMGSYDQLGQDFRKRVEPAPLLKAISTAEEEIRVLGLDRKKAVQQEEEDEHESEEEQKDSEKPLLIEEDDSEDDYFVHHFGTKNGAERQKQDKRGGSKRTYLGRSEGGRASRGKRGRRGGSSSSRNVQSYFER